MKKLIGRKLYNTSKCEVLASRSHYNNGTYCGSTELLLAPDGALLVGQFANGQSLYLEEFLIPFDEFSEGIDYFDEIDDEQTRRLAELGLIEIV